MAIMLKLMFALLLIFLNFPAVASPALGHVNTNTVSTQPHKVLFGVYPVSIYDFDLTHGSYKISFYAWWRTDDPTYKPQDRIEITNAEDYYSKFGEYIKLNDHDYVTYVHYYATMQYKFKFKDFPFDRQFLEVRMEDFKDINEIEFEPDYAQSFIHPELVLEGWKVSDIILKKSVTNYKTNFGDPASLSNLFSRLTFIIEIKRQGWRSYFDYFVGFFMAAFLCMVIFIIDIEAMQPRMVVAAAAIFACMGNKYIISQLIPITSKFSLTDAIQSSTFIMLGITILSAALLPFGPQEGLQKKRKINNLIGVVVTLGYITVVTIFTYKAVTS